MFVVIKNKNSDTNFKHNKKIMILLFFKERVIPYFHSFLVEKITMNK